MAGREVREYTNLSDPKGAYLGSSHYFLIVFVCGGIDFFRVCIYMAVVFVLVAAAAAADKKWGKGKDRIDDEDITFQRMVAKVSGSDLLLPSTSSAYFMLASCFSLLLAVMVVFHYVLETSV